MEWFMIFFCMFLGILFGVFTGLLPGIHINLIAGLILAYFGFFTNYFSLLMIVVFILSMSITHTFIDFIPSIIFGVPNSETALSVLPGHRLILEGKGYLAIFLSSIGSLFGIIFLFFLLPILFLFLEQVYEFLKGSITYILILILFFMLFLDFGNKNKFFWSIVIISFSSAVGFLVLNTYLINDALLVIFTGLFGVSSLVFSLLFEQGGIPKQSYSLSGFRFSSDFFKAVFAGGIASSVCSIAPGVGNAQAATLVSLFFRQMSAELFIVMLSVINTINFALSIVTFHLIARARNGSILAVSQILSEITIENLWFFLGIILVCGIICFFLTLIIGKIILKTVLKLDLVKVNFAILIFLFFIVFFLTNFYGVLILCLCSSLGLLCLTLGVKRIHMMSVLLVPVIFNLL